MIDATTFRLNRTADQEAHKNESGEDVLEVINNPGHTVSFTGTVKSGQTPLIIGDLLTLTYPASHDPTGAKEYVVTAASNENYGRGLKQTIEAKLNNAADYSPA